MIKTKKFLKNGLIIALSAAFAFSVAGCGGNVAPSDTGSEEQSGSQKQEIVVDSVATGYTRYDVGEKLARTTEGFGAQFDTCMVEEQNKLIIDWDVQVNALKTMNLQTVRIRFYPEMYERGNDNDDPARFDFSSDNVDFHSAEMQHLYRLLDVFEENEVRVDLSWYGCRTTFASEDGQIKGSWLGGKYGEQGVNSWMVAPRLTEHPDEEFSESVSACLYYLLDEKKYTCIYEYSLFPEPEGVIADMGRYAKIAEDVKTRLSAYGIRDKLKFSGPADYNNDAGIFDSKYLSKVDYDKATSSVYKFHGEVVGSSTGTPSGNDEILAFAKSYVSVCDKYNISWGIAESGTSNFKTPVSNYDTDLFDRAMTMTRLFIGCVNAGCTNIKYFIFSDCMYDGVMNEEGLFRARGSNYAGDLPDWSAKPVWYAWSMICACTDIGSEVYPITVDYTTGDKDICITALHLPDGSWTYVAANIGKSMKKIALVNGRADRADKMNVYTLTEASIPEDLALKLLDAKTTADTSGGVAYFNIPAGGIAILSDKTL